MSKDPLTLFYEAHLEEAQGRLDSAAGLYRKAVVHYAGTNRYDAAGQALLALAHISEVQGDSAAALAFARRQKLDGEEYDPISFLEAVMGDPEASDRSLQQYGAAVSRLTPAGVQIFRARNQLVAALQHGDAGALPAAPRLPMLPETWVPFYEARAALLRRDYGSAEHLLRRALFLHRWVMNLTTSMHARSPLVMLLCHYYLGEICEATGRRDQASGEYREFLSVFGGVTTRLPQVAAAHAALKRLGAQ